MIRWWAEHLYLPESPVVRLCIRRTRESENSPVRRFCQLSAGRASSTPATRCHDNVVYRYLLAAQVRWRSPPSLGSSLWLTLKPPGTSGREQKRGGQMLRRDVDQHKPPLTFDTEPSPFLDVRRRFLSGD